MSNFIPWLKLLLKLCSRIEYLLAMPQMYDLWAVGLKLGQENVPGILFDYLAYVGD